MDEKIKVVPMGSKKSGAWIIKGIAPPPPATSGIEVFYGRTNTCLSKKPKGYS